MKHEIEFIHSVGGDDCFYYYNADEIKIGEDVYSIHCKDFDEYTVYKNNEIFDAKEFKDLVMKCDYTFVIYEEIDPVFGTYYYPHFVRIKTVEGIEGIYIGPDNYEWYSNP